MVISLKWYSYQFQCDGELGNLKDNAIVRSIGLGHTDGLTSVDGMGQMSQSDEVQMSLSDDVKDKKLQAEREKESLDVRYLFNIAGNTKMHYIVAW